MADQAWGPGAYSLRYPDHGNLAAKLFNLLSLPSLADCYWLFLLGQVVFIFLGLLGRWPTVSALFVFLFTINLFNKANGMSNGGHHIIQLMLVYNLFMSECAGAVRGRWDVIRNAAANLAFLAARIQLCIMYAAAGFYKLTGTLWLKGEAMYYIINVEEYSHPFLAETIGSSAPVHLAANYFGLAYQLLFSVLIWIKRARRPLLLVGVFFHLFIAFGMGLVDFGFAMIACYFLFVEEEKSSSLLKRIRSFRPPFFAGKPA